MAKDAKSAATKPASAQAGTKPAAAGAADVLPPKKNKKMLIIIIAAVVLLIGGGAAAFLLLQPPAHPTKKDAAATEKAEHEARVKNPPKFVEIGTFTANLVREEGDRFLQVGISLKITKPELEEKIKASSPEILHRVNMLLQSKRPSDLSTIEGKEQLSLQIKGQVEYVLGLRRTAPSISTESAGTQPAETPDIKSDIAEVLFTSFIIQ